MKFCRISECIHIQNIIRSVKEVRTVLGSVLDFSKFCFERKKGKGESNLFQQKLPEVFKVFHFFSKGELRWLLIKSISSSLRRKVCKRCDVKSCKFFAFGCVALDF